MIHYYNSVLVVRGLRMRGCGVVWLIVYITFSSAVSLVVQV